MYVLTTILTFLLFRGVAAKFTRTEFLELSFLFDWTTAGAGTTTIAQCDSLNITWSRSSATGPNPTAPYSLSVYTSTFDVPVTVDAGSGLSFNWPVPFAPGTQFQICMFDANGYTGGCQRQVTVYPSIDANTTCTNVTFAEQLDVDAQVSNGPISQYGWIDQCTDIQLIPKNGTPPYTMTVAPTLHPPYNITLENMESVNWTVALSWASPFWVTLVDSIGNGRSYGPLHSGYSGTGVTDSCLSTDSNGVSSSAAIGASIGSAVLGLLIGLLGTYCLGRRFARRSFSPRSIARSSMTSLMNAMLPVSLARSADSSADESSTNNQQVYVVHHDGGRAPVTVYTAGGAEVVELPPGYDIQQSDDAENSGTEADPTLIQPQARPSSSIRKTG